MGDLGNTEVEELSWFHPNLNRHHAEALLIQNGQDGSYLLRQSSTNKGEYSLSVRCASAAKHFQIGWDGSHYTFGMGRFSTLNDFVEHFANKPLIGGESGVLTLLKHPYPRDVQEPVSYETIRVHAEWGNRPSSGNDANQSANVNLSINSKEGYLTKLGRRVKLPFFQNWKARWFVLVKNELKYYKTKGDKEPIRIIDLTKCEGIEDDDTLGKTNCFKVMMPSRVFHIYASSSTEKEEWMSVLKWKLGHVKNCAD